VSTVIRNLLRDQDIHPVLVDVGASGEPPSIWRQIAPVSTYVGFDPDLREMHEIPNDRFHKAIIVNAAVSDIEGSTEANFYLTQSPYCSSMLPPDKASLENYMFASLFNVERQVKVKSTTLKATVEQLALRSIDWLKVDTQGTDLRIFMSLKPEDRSRILALDVEPGLIDAYVGEDLFVDVHRSLTRSGFWLSNFNLHQTVRMRRSTAQRTIGEISEAAILAGFPKSPGWCEARYLRTIDSMEASRVAAREYALLWVFALMDKQIGYALDIALEYERVFGRDEVSSVLRSETLTQVYTFIGWKRLYERAKKILRPVVRPLKRQLRR
jgi:FkbM family methyltransferase